MYLLKQVTENPIIKCEVQNKRLVLAIDKSLFLLEDDNVPECNYLSFSANIDSICVSPSGDLVLCALADGNIHGIYIKGVPLFNL